MRQYSIYITLAIIAACCMIAQAIVAPLSAAMLIGSIVLGITYAIHEAILFDWGWTRYDSDLTCIADVCVAASTMMSIIILSVNGMDTLMVWMLITVVFFTLIFIAGNMSRYVCCPLYYITIPSLTQLPQTSSGQSGRRRIRQTASEQYSNR
jgi:hypothetical protein